MRDHIFLSYRRSDTADFAGRLHDSLAPRYPVFRDIAEIAPGEDFRQRLHQALTRCRVLLAVIGDGWLHALDEQGRRRLDDPSDWVRQEISQALARGVRVIPVLAEETRMPEARDLPDDLKPLADRQAVRVLDAYFAEGVRKLTKGIGAPIHWARWALCAASIIGFVLGTLAIASPRVLARAVAAGGALEMQGLRGDDALFTFHQPAAVQVNVSSDFTNAKLLPRSARFLGLSGAAPGRIEILTTNSDAAGDPCRTTITLAAVDSEPDLLVMREKGPVAAIKLRLLRGRLRVSQITVAADASQPHQSGCEKEIRVAGARVRARQVPVNLELAAPAELYFQFAGDAPQGSGLFPKFLADAATFRAVRRFAGDHPQRLWKAPGKARGRVVEWGLREGEVQVVMDGPVAETPPNGQPWKAPVLASGVVLLGLLGRRWNGFPVPRWCYRS